MPLANQFYWQERKNFEKSAHERSKRYDLIASTAKTYTILFKTHTRLYQIAQEQSQIEEEIRKFTAEKASMDLIQVYASRLAAIDALRSDLEKERIQSEGQLCVISAMIFNYFSRDITDKFGKVALLYDQRTSAPEPYLPARTDPVVKDTEDLIKAMAEEVKKYESK